MSSLTDSRDAPGGGAARKAVRRARRSTALSWAAVLAAIAIVLVFVAQAGLFAYLTPKPKVVVPEIGDPEIITSYDSTLSGIDGDNQPYEVKAARGWQDRERAELLHMEVVSGKFHRATGEPFDVTARTASYDSKIKEIDLMGDVVIDQQNRFTARMDKAHVVMRDKKLTSDVPVVVTFGQGNIHANGLQITGDGANILFLNGVKAHFAATPPQGETTP